VRRIAIACLLALLVSTAASADDAPKAGAKRHAAAKPDAGEKQDVGTSSDPKKMSGISILGNREAPKSLVIVPWKSSAIGDSIGISRALDTKPAPVDRDVFARELSYYEIRLKSDAK
jgi:hypothetical protein